MTPKEAINVMEKYTDITLSKVVIEAHNMAIEALEKQAEYKSLKEQGLLLRLPCNVGNMVYQIMNNSDACSDCPHYSEYYGMDSRCTKDSWNTVYNPKWKREPVCDEHFYEIIEIKTDLEYIARHLNDFGKSVFLTKEEAEATLEKMKGGAE